MVDYFGNHNPVLEEHIRGWKNGKGNTPPAIVWVGRAADDFPVPSLPINALCSECFPRLVFLYQVQLGEPSAPATSKQEKQTKNIFAKQIFFFQNRIKKQTRATHLTEPLDPLQFFLVLIYFSLPDPQLIQQLGLVSPQLSLGLLQGLIDFPLLLERVFEVCDFLQRDTILAISGSVHLVTPFTCTLPNCVAHQNCRRPFTHSRHPKVVLKWVDPVHSWKWNQEGNLASVLTRFNSWN